VTRWTRRLLLSAVAVLVPALAGCEAGLNAPTLQFHAAAFGTTTIVDGIAIDNVFVLGPPLNSTLPAGGQAGVFLALDAQNGDRLMSVTAPGAASSVKLIQGPVNLAPGALVDLAGPVPDVVLSGLTSPLSGGQTVQLVLDFATAGEVPLQVPVEPAAYEYATYSPPPPVTPLAKPKPSASGTASASASPAASASPSPTP
jgi:copper(I)-binding protein